MVSRQTIQQPTKKNNISRTDLFLMIALTFALGKDFDVLVSKITTLRDRWD